MFDHGAFFIAIIMTKSERGIPNIFGLLSWFKISMLLSANRISGSDRLMRKPAVGGNWI